MTERAPVRFACPSATRHLLSLAGLTLGVAAAGAWIAGCTPKDPPPVDPVALQQLDEDESGDTRYLRLPPLPADEYYLNRRDRNDPRNYNPSPLVDAQMARGADVDTGEIGLQIPTTQPA